MLYVTVRNNLGIAASSTKLSSDNGVAVRELATAPGIGPDEEEAESDDVPDTAST